jgi:hypothetical protein
MPTLSTFLSNSAIANLYAKKQHEELSYDHDKGKAKFLEENFNTVVVNEGQLLKNIQIELSKVL